MNEREIYDLIGKYLANETTPAEETLLKNWANHSAENKHTLETFSKIWKNTKTQYIHKEKDAVFEKVLNSISDEKKSDKLVNFKQNANRKSYSYLVRVAAVLVLFTVSTVVWYSYFQQQSDTEVALVQEVWEERSNPAGQKSKIFLPDGSEIVLNAESKIRFKKNFNSGAIREVELSGEAFFEVKPNPDRPFVVNARNVLTTALGTSFNIDAYSESDVKVSLATGKVEVKNSEATTTEDSLVYLIPGEEAMVKKQEGKITKDEFDAQSVLSWKEGIIHFKKASFNEIVQKLERWYDVDFEIKDAKNTTGTFSDNFDNESLELVMEGISFSYGFKYKLEGKKVTIY
ncbi:MAG: hypothetical protein CMO01_08640 [Thalassobius sp.]|nr:hypothetical protein [Thalassovita sp.]